MSFPRDIKELNTPSLDTNSVSDSTASLNTMDSKYVSYCVVGVTGTHSTHVCVLECSPDDTNWYEMSDSTLSGLGAKFSMMCIFKHVRIKVRTAEGGTSTVRVFIQAK